MSLELEKLERRASVIVREPSHKDDGYHEDKENFEHEYELEDLNGEEMNNNLLVDLNITHSNFNEMRDKKAHACNSIAISTNSNQGINPFSNRFMLHNSNRSDHANIYRTAEDREEEDKQHTMDYEDDYEDDDYDRYYNNNTNNGALYKILPRTLPNSDFFIEVETDKECTTSSNLNDSHRYIRRYNCMSNRFPLTNTNVEIGKSKNFMGKPSDDYYNGNNLSPFRFHRFNSSVGYSTDNNSLIKVTSHKNDYSYKFGQNVCQLVARPPVNSQDKLLAEMEELYKVKNNATNMNIYDSFPEGIEEKLRDLRHSHVKIIQLLREREARAEEQRRRALQASNNNNFTLGNLNNNVTSNKPMSENENKKYIIATHSTSNSGDNRGGTGLSKATSIGGSSRNQYAATVWGMTAPSLMNNPETKKYVNLLVDTIKEL